MARSLTVAGDVAFCLEDVLDAQIERKPYGPSDRREGFPHVRIALHGGRVLTASGDAAELAWSNIQQQHGRPCGPRQEPPRDLFGLLR